MISPDSDWGVDAAIMGVGEAGDASLGFRGDVAHAPVHQHLVPAGGEPGAADGDLCPASSSAALGGNSRYLGIANQFNCSIILRLQTILRKGEYCSILQQD